MQVFNLLDALQFGEDEIGVGADTHGAPRLVVVVVFLQHQLQGVVGVAVVERHSFVGGDVDLVDVSAFELNESHDAVVDQCDELGPDAFAHERFFLLFERAYALGLDEELVGQRRRAQYAPRGSVVVQFLFKQRATFLHHCLELLFCISIFHIWVQRYKKS